MRDPIVARRRRSAWVWGAVAVVLAVVAWPDAAALGARPIVAWVALTAAASGLAWWTALYPTRMAYDLSQPLIAATAVALGPDLAPFGLVAQAGALALVTAVTNRQPPSLAVVNVGVLGLQGWVLAAVLVLGWGWAGAAGPSGLVAVVVTATAVALVVNYLTTWASVAYIYRGEASRPTGDLSHHLRDLVGAGLLAVLAGPAEGPLLIVASLLLVGHVVQLIERERIHHHASYLELQGRVLAMEEGGSLLGDHTRRVVDIVAEMVGDLPARERARAERAAWFHGLVMSSLPGRCSSGTGLHPIADHIRALPSSWRIDSTLEPIRGGHPLRRADRVSITVATACAVDALRHPDTPIRSAADLPEVFGLPAELVARAAVIAGISAG